MMAVVGILGAELLGVPTKWYEAGAAEYDLPVIAQVPIFFLVSGFFETKRYIGFKETGTVSRRRRRRLQLGRAALAAGSAGHSGSGGWHSLGDGPSRGMLSWPSVFACSRA